MAKSIFIVLAPSGCVLLIEQKFDFLSETKNALVKPYAGEHRHVATQMMRNISALINRLGRTGCA
jgi:hypothetical protein